jgi:hypothetical protein
MITVSVWVRGVVPSQHPPPHRGFEMIEAALLHSAGQLRAEAAGPEWLSWITRPAGRTSSRLFLDRFVSSGAGAKVDQLAVDFILHERGERGRGTIGLP